MPGLVGLHELLQLAAELLVLLDEVLADLRRALWVSMLAVVFALVSVWDPALVLVFEWTLSWHHTFMHRAPGI